jgi:predicted nucleotide-binding protein
MARKQQSTEPKRATLQVPRSEAEDRVKAQIEKGRQILTRTIQNESELEDARREMQIWSDYNIELLKRIVDTNELASSYRKVTIRRAIGRTPLIAKARNFYSDVEYYVNRLESILSRLELIPESAVLVQPVEAQSIGSHPEVSRRVFVVHGHDEEAKQSVARCLEKLELEAIILHEQPSQGRTIIEKFEDYADVGFAVVLLTPDDMGAAKDETGNLRPRARQNVVFELGFFVGKLGRQQVCALHKGDVEIPSDFAGVLWVPMDPKRAWRFTLGREMKAAGLDVDLNKLANL